MPRVVNHARIRNPGDILARASRPQHHSSFLPRRRDWRYESGVFAHEDWSDAPRQASVWDELDYDAQKRVAEMERRRASGNQNGGGNSADKEVDMMEVDGKEHEDGASSLLHTVAAFKSHGNGSWELNGLVVVLRFSERGMRAVKRIEREETTESAELDEDYAPETASELVSSLKNLRMSATNNAARMEDEDTELEYDGEWEDETQNFSMKQIVSSLRPKNQKVYPIPASWTWFPSAVPVDAIFPPGIALSATEILAFYPHHIRWKDVLTRLVNNAYRGPDIVAIQSFFRATPRTHLRNTTQLNQMLRDTLRRTIPTFKTTEGAWEGTPDKNLYTDHWIPGRFVEETRGGGMAPTFEDLLRGLRCFPSGIDARDLTTCLAWYARVRHTFTPSLDLNVLHTQALVRALRIPLRPVGDTNLDMNALEAWKRDGRLPTKPINKGAKNQTPQATKASGERDKSQLEINTKTESVKLHVTIPVRHILTFPFLSLLGMAAKCLEMGVAKAEERRTARLALAATKIPTPGKTTFTRSATPLSQDERHSKRDSHTAGLSPTYHIPKRAKPESEVGVESVVDDRVGTNPSAYPGSESGFSWSGRRSEPRSAGYRDEGYRAGYHAHQSHYGSREGYRTQQTQYESREGYQTQQSHYSSRDGYQAQPNHYRYRDGYQAQRNHYSAREEYRPQQHHFATLPFRPRQTTPQYGGRGGYHSGSGRRGGSHTPQSGHGSNMGWGSRHGSDAGGDVYGRR